jgi:hypothetical protein
MILLLTTILMILYFTAIGLLSVLILLAITFTLQDILNRDTEGTLIGSTITVILSLILACLCVFGLLVI